MNIKVSYVKKESIKNSTYLMFVSCKHQQCQHIMHAILL